MKIGNITFHSPHNYGSMLQAYALQQTIRRMGHDYEIINFRSKKQRDFYVPFFTYIPNLKKIGIRILFPKLYWGAKKKYQNFENFLQNDLRVTSREFHTLTELENASHDYDAFISGSDQIWNIFCFDWNLAYYLTFTKRAKKIAYAPSMGGKPEISKILKSKDIDIIRNALRDYKSISVREESTAQIIKELIGKTPQVTLDPTLLLSASEWNELETQKPIVNDDYILLYTPWENSEVYEKALMIGKRLKMKVVVTMHYGFKKYSNNRNLIFKVATGPKEFLNLVRNSRMVIGASFHAAAFAVIYGKQLYAFEGMEDNRVSTLLKFTGLEDFAKEPAKLIDDDELTKIYNTPHIKLESKKEESLQFLREALS